MALEMKQQEYIDDRINNEPININFSKTLKSVIKDAEKRADEYKQETNDIKKKIVEDNSLSNNESIQEMISMIDNYLVIVADEPATKTYYLNALDDMLKKLNTLIDKIKEKPIDSNNANITPNTNITKNIKNSEQSNEWWLKALIADDNWMKKNEGINEVQLR